MEMPRATITISVDDAEEIAAAQAWFAQWSASVTRKSDNYGCGCCLDMYDLEASQEAVEAIPYALTTTSEWVETGEGFGGKH
jgi:hypothetical protein